ncbi:MAG: WhiB family transcriptional regulator [Actinomycetota bacterium]
MFTTTVLDGLEAHAGIGHDPEPDAPALSSFARCSDGAGTLSSLFFSDDPFDQARAQAVCRTCGLADECLRGALDRAEPAGVWGGKILVDGVAVDVKRRRGRPPKTPRPAPIVDEVPLPPHLVA